jgi:predicted nucleic acid-binding protein
MFWDASALVPYLVEESRSAEIQPLFVNDQAVVIWWCTPVECASALERRTREGLPEGQHREAHQRLMEIVAFARHVPPHETIRESAMELLRRYPLRALDALQLAAAKSLSDRVARYHTDFVSLDKSLRNAAQHEGLTLVPQ